MPTIPETYFSTTSNRHAIYARLSSPGLISANELRIVLSDALLSFSPLATLVGAQSAYSLAHRVTNIKQCLVASLAPIGALGMMASVARAADLPGVKEMLGVGGTDIKDSARELGCGAISSDVIPRMDGEGSLISDLKGDDLEHAACAIVRQKWETGHGTVAIKSLRRAFETFVAGTMSGRIVWEVNSEEAAVGMVENIQQALSNSSGGSSELVFDWISMTKGGRGTVELQWPAPAMPLETNSLPVNLYLLFFSFGFLFVAFFAASPSLGWQSVYSSIFLVGGQFTLILGQVTTQYAVKSQRETLRVETQANSLGSQWMLIDRSRFTTAVARRPFLVTKRGSVITLSQFHKFKRNYIATWHAVFTLLALAGGFIAFYIGGKSSNVKTVVVYICLFLLANLMKGLVVLYANKPQHKRLNNFGRIVDEVKDIEVQARPAASISKLDLHPELFVFPLRSFAREMILDYSSFQIYSKFSLKEPRAVDMFFFSSKEEWALAAHVIRKAIKPIIPLDDLGYDSELDNLTLIPLYHWDGTTNFRGILLMTIDHIRPENLFRSVGMEVVSILMGNFDSPNTLCSESEQATDSSFLASLVYTLTRMLLSDHVYCADKLLPCRRRGVHNLMRAIEDTTTTMKNPGNSMPWLLEKLNSAALAAKNVKGAKLKSKALILHEDAKFKRAMCDSAPLHLKNLDIVKAWRTQLHNLEQVNLRHDRWGKAEMLEMLTLVVDAEHARLTTHLQDEAARLMDQLRIIENQSSAKSRRAALRDEEIDELVSEIRTMPPENPFSLMPSKRQMHLELLRRRKRQWDTEQDSKRKLGGKGEVPGWRKLQQDIQVFAIRCAAALEELEERLRENLRQELEERARGREEDTGPLFGQHEQRRLEIVERQIELLEKEMGKGMEKFEEPENLAVTLQLLELERRHLLELQQLSSMP